MRLAPRSFRFVTAVAAAAAVAVPLVLRAQEGGIVIYENTDFRGRGTVIDGNVPDLREYGFDRQVLSFRVAPGQLWELCSGRAFTGRCRIFTDTVTDLRRVDWNDEIMSIRRARQPERPVFAPMPPGSLELYAGTDYSGQRIVLTGAAPDFRRFNFNDRALSLRTLSGEVWEVCYNINYDDCRVVDGELPNLVRFNLTGISSARPRGQGWQLRPASSIELYSGRDFSGDFRVLTGVNPDLNRQNFNDRAESLRVPRGQSWEVCVNAGFDDCRVVDRDIPDLSAIGLHRNISSVRPHVIR